MSKYKLEITVSNPDKGDDGLMTVLSYPNLSYEALVLLQERVGGALIQAGKDAVELLNSK